ncbi:MAG: hypothetical protein HYS41_04525 [Candidatus Omnitrophica bacterium]|nr:hypothetical protein [Candidatus Omnitrophota bacterium]
MRSRSRRLLALLLALTFEWTSLPLPARAADGEDSPPSAAEKKQTAGGISSHSWSKGWNVELEEKALQELEAQKAGLPSVISDEVSDFAGSLKQIQPADDRLRNPVAVGLEEALRSGQPTPAGWMDRREFGRRALFWAGAAFLGLPRPILGQEAPSPGPAQPPTRRFIENLDAGLVKRMTLWRQKTRDFFTAQKMEGPVKAPEGFRVQGYQSYQSDPRHPFDRYLGVERFWAYDMGVTLKYLVGRGEMEEAQWLAGRMIDIARQMEAKGQKGGWRFSYGTTFTDARAMSGGTAWVFKGLYLLALETKDPKFLNGINTKLAETAFAQQVTDPADPRYGLFRAGFGTGNESDFEKSNLQREEITTEHNWDYIDALRLAYRANQTADFQSPFLREIASRHELAMKESKRLLLTPEKVKAQLRRLELEAGGNLEKGVRQEHERVAQIIQGLPGKRRWATGMDPDGTLNLSWAADNEVWSPQGAYDPEMAENELKNVERHFLRTLKAQGFSHLPQGVDPKEEFTGVIFFDPNFKDPHVPPNENYDRMLQPEITWSIIFRLVQFGYYAADLEKREWAYALAQKLIRSMLRLAEIYGGAPYATLDIRGFFNTMLAVASNGHQGIVLDDLLQEGLPADDYLNVLPDREMKVAGQAPRWTASAQAKEGGSPGVSVKEVRLNGERLNLTLDGVPDGALATSWVEDDLQGEEGVWYIQPTAESVGQIQRGQAALSNWRADHRRFRKDHTLVVIVKDRKAWEAFQGRLKRDKTFLTTVLIKELLADKAFVEKTGFLLIRITGEQSAELLKPDAGLEELRLGKEEAWQGALGGPIGVVRPVLDGKGEPAGRVVLPDLSRLKLVSAWDPEVEGEAFPEFQTGPVDPALLERFRRAGLTLEAWQEKAKAPPEGLPPGAQRVYLSNSGQHNLKEPYGFLVALGRVIRPHWAWEKYPLDVQTLRERGYDDSFWAFVLEPGPPRMAALRFGSNRGDSPGIEELVDAQIEGGRAVAREARPSEILHAVSGMPLVLDGKDVSGQLRWSVREDGIPLKVRPNELVWNPRERAGAMSAIGVRDDGQIILLWVTAHVTAREMARLLLEAGAVSGSLWGGSADTQQELFGTHPILKAAADLGSKQRGQIGRPLVAALAGYETGTVSGGAGPSAPLGAGLEERSSASRHVARVADYEGPVAVVGKMGVGEDQAIVFRAGIPQGFWGPAEHERIFLKPDRSDAPGEIVERLVQAIRRVVERYGPDRVMYVYFSVPGFVDSDGALVERISWLPVFPKGFSFKEEVQKRLDQLYEGKRDPSLGRLEVDVVSNARAGARGEVGLRGTCPGVDNLLFVHIGNGIAAQMVVNGKSFQGEPEILYHSEAPHHLIFTGNPGSPDYRYVARETKGFHPTLAPGEQDLEDRVSIARILARARELLKADQLTLGGLVAAANRPEKERGENPAKTAIWESGRELGIALAVWLMETRSIFRERFEWPDYVVLGSTRPGLSELMIPSVQSGFSERLERYRGQGAGVPLDLNRNTLANSFVSSTVGDEADRVMLGGLPSPNQVDLYESRLRRLPPRGIEADASLARLEESLQERRVFHLDVPDEVKSDPALSRQISSLLSKIGTVDLEALQRGEPFPPLKGVWGLELRWLGSGRMELVASPAGSGAPFEGYRRFVQETIRPTARAAKAAVLELSGSGVHYLSAEGGSLNLLREVWLPEGLWLFLRDRQMRLVLKGVDQWDDAAWDDLAWLLDPRTLRLNVPPVMDPEIRGYSLPVWMLQGPGGPLAPLIGYPTEFRQDPQGWLAISQFVVRSRLFHQAVVPLADGLYEMDLRRFAYHPAKRFLQMLHQNGLFRIGLHGGSVLSLLAEGGRAERAFKDLDLVLVAEKEEAWEVQEEINLLPEAKSPEEAWRLERLAPKIKGLCQVLGVSDPRALFPGLAQDAGLKQPTFGRGSEEKIVELWGGLLDPAGLRITEHAAGKGDPYQGKLMLAAEMMVLLPHPADPQKAILLDPYGALRSLEEKRPLILGTSSATLRESKPWGYLFRIIRRMVIERMEFDPENRPEERASWREIRILVENLTDWGEGIPEGEEKQKTRAELEEWLRRLFAATYPFSFRAVGFLNELHVRGFLDIFGIDPQIVSLEVEKGLQAAAARIDLERRLPSAGQEPSVESGLEDSAAVSTQL